jgi:hypothetical protein
MTYFVKDGDKVEWFIEPKPDRWAGQYLVCELILAPAFERVNTIKERVFIPFGSIGDVEVIALAAAQLIMRMGLPATRFQHTLRVLTFGVPTT